MPRARHRALRRRSVRARRRARADPGDREPLLSRTRRTTSPRPPTTRPRPSPACRRARSRRRRGAPGSAGDRTRAGRGRARRRRRRGRRSCRSRSRSARSAAPRWRRTRSATTARRSGASIAPKVIVEHYTVSDTFASAYNTFAPDRADSELHELPGTCAHFVIDKDGTIYQLVPLSIRCRHTVGLNYTAIGIEHVGRSAARRPRRPTADRRVARAHALAHGALPDRPQERDRPRREPLEPLPPRARRRASARRPTATGPRARWPRYRKLL